MTDYQDQRRPESERLALIEQRVGEHDKLFTQIATDMGKIAVNVQEISIIMAREQGGRTALRIMGNAISGAVGAIGGIAASLGMVKHP